MMLYDRLLQKGTSIVNPDDMDMPMIRKLMKRAFVVRVDQIAEYLSEPKRRKWDKIKDFPDLSPPWPEMWFEWNDPSSKTTYGMLVATLDRRHEDGPDATCWEYEFEKSDSVRWACNGHLFSMTDKSHLTHVGHFYWGVSQDGSFHEATGVKEYPDEPGRIKMMRQMTGRYVPGEEIMRNADGVCVTPSMEFFVECVTGTKLSKHYLKYANGDPIEGEKNRVRELKQTIEAMGSITKMTDGANASIRRLMVLAEIPLMALQFLNCKNMKTIREPAHSHKVQRNRVRLGRLPLVRSHILHISPTVTESSGSHTKDAGDEALTAVHIARGHSKDYRHGNGLYGKHKGIFWWTMQARGNKKAGIVVKTYEVDRPKSEEK